MHSQFMWRSLLLILSVVLAGCGPMGKKPTGTLDRYVAAEPVASQRDMARLVELLHKGDVATFNQLRTNAPYTGKRLDFRGSSFTGLRLVGANLSNSILANVDLTGANLSNACFRGSYLASAQIDRPWPPITNRTCLANCDFTGAILKATEYVMLAGDPRPFELIDVWTKTEPRLDLYKADAFGASGIDFSIPDASRFGVAGAPPGHLLKDVLTGLVLPAIELAALALGLFYLYLKHLQRMCRLVPPEEDPKTWTGHGIEASNLKSHLETVRRDHLAARQGPRASRFHQHWLGFTRQAILRLRYFRRGEESENVQLNHR